MGNVAVRVEGLGKMYRIGGKQERYRTLRDSLTDAVSAPFKRARSLLHGQAYGAAGLDEEIWALKDVSFEVKHGEVVGIIGRNGAGKSTLLKILSRITEPTEGYADVYGRVGSLLEVGTGFHPELTGRENIYLNGAILGMSRAEIDRKFDEIVDFAEVERFIDTPVKHYSSGMGLRLGFAVAAHLEPEILVVDEVLAVGDAQFQKKCLGKMSDVASEGRTVLFVSHNLAAIARLCHRGLVLENGYSVRLGTIGDALSHYIRSLEETPNNLSKDSEVIITNPRLEGPDGEPSIYDPTKSSMWTFKLYVNQPVLRFRMTLAIRNEHEFLIVRKEVTQQHLPELRNFGVYLVGVHFPPLWLSSGQYTFYIRMIAELEAKKIDFRSEQYLFTVMRFDVTDNEASEVLAPSCDWRFEVLK